MLALMDFGKIICIQIALVFSVAHGKVAAAHVKCSREEVRWLFTFLV